MLFRGGLPEPRAGSLLNYADLARDVGTSPNTSKHWVSLLATSGLITVLEGWSRNASSRLVKSPKVYFNDTGLLCALFGAVWETLGLSQIWIWLNNRGRLQQNLFYWRTKEGKPPNSPGKTMSLTLVCCDARWKGPKSAQPFCAGSPSLWNGGDPLTWRRTTAVTLTGCLGEPFSRGQRAQCLPGS